MGRKSESLQHALLGRAMKEKENNNTETLYKKRIKIFVKWAKEQGCKRPEDITKDVVQAYEQVLETAPEGYAPATIHTYLSPVCAAAGVSMREIRKPKRTAGAITRGRDRAADGTRLDRNPDGKRQEGQQKYARVVALQRVTGIRRAELGKLKGSDLIRKGNSWYVRVRRGKGGKSQLQYILPKDVETVREIFEGIGPDQKVFCKEEMSNKINLHGLRAKHSKDCYGYYTAEGGRSEGMESTARAVRERYGRPPLQAARGKSQEGAGVGPAGYLQQARIDVRLGITPEPLAAGRYGDELSHLIEGGSYV